MKKGKKIAVVAAAVVVLGGVGSYLSQTLIKWKMMEYYIMPSFVDGVDVIEEYPYADIEVPDEFRACTIKGIDFEAPDGLFWMYPDETEGVKSGIIVDNDDPDKRTLLVCVMDKEDTGITVEQFENMGYFDKRMNKGLKKLGYEKPENAYELLRLCDTFDYRKCNKFSPSEVNATYNIMELKAILVPTTLSYSFGAEDVKLGEEIESKRFRYENGNMKSFIQQGAAKNGAYELVLDVYDVDDLDTPQTVIILGDDVDTVRQIAKTVDISED
ncbi:MAG: hypothetical protein Q4A05_01620 [Ruminococcus sp.]|nr:hypothetical protein [Ruminococcus sp.]